MGDFALPGLLGLDEAVLSEDESHGADVVGAPIFRALELPKETLVFFVFLEFSSCFCLSVTGGEDPGASLKDADGEARIIGYDRQNPTLGRDLLRR